MDKKIMLKVFAEAFLRSLIVLMAALIVGFAAFFFIKVNSDRNSPSSNNDMYAQGQAATTGEPVMEEPTTEEITTEEPTTEEITTEELTTEEATTEEQTIPSTDRKILVLNSTGVGGVAKAWKDKLAGAGFSDVAMGNYSVSSEQQTRIFVPEEGMGQDLLGFFQDAVIVVDRLGDSGIEIVTEGVTAGEVEIFVVVGSNDTTVR